MERVSFVGATVPVEIRALPALLAQVPEKAAAPLLKEVLAVAVSYIEGVSVSEDHVAGLCKPPYTQEVIGGLISGAIALLRAALRAPETSLKSEFLAADLEQMQIRHDFASMVAKLVTGPRRKAIEAAALQNSIRLPALQTLKWRVDVSISTSMLKRALKPSILMQMTLSDGRIHSFEVPVDQFHALRYNVAYLLKEMEDLEKRSVMQS